MKNIFIINIAYRVDLKIIEQNLSAHRAFLQIGYKKGFLIASGPRTPRVGGCVIGVFNSIQNVDEFIKNDPFYVNNLAKYEIVEFSPVLHNECLNALLGTNA